MSKLPQLLGRCPRRFQWTLHNVIAHPLSELVYQLGWEDLSHRIHDGTVPTHPPGTGRG